jgi:hypothetical protein
MKNTTLYHYCLLLSARLSFKIKLLMFGFIGCLILLIAPAKAQQPFVHPGILNTASSLTRIKQKVKNGENPWMEGFKALKKNPLSDQNYKVQGGFEYVSRAAGHELYNHELQNDCDAAYDNALMFAITGDDQHAKKTIEILNAWSYTLKGIIGKDSFLMSSIYSTKMLNAAEIIRYTYNGWQAKDIEQFKHMMKDVFYPVIENFYPKANGNWDAGAIKAMMAMGVFLDDRAIFDKGVDHYYHGEGPGSLSHYIINENGQCQESARDQAHAQLGLGHLAEACETGYNQGLDMYGADNNLLLKGFEYTAKYNLGYTVPFAPYKATGIAGGVSSDSIATEQRGNFRPIYEMVWNHYEKRKGLKAPFTKKAAEKTRPEADGPRPTDQAGYGTLTFSLP